jgi:hypothetical protein
MLTGIDIRSDARFAHIVADVYVYDLSRYSIIWRLAIAITNNNHMHRL